MSPTIHYLLRTCGQGGARMSPLRVPPRPWLYLGVITMGLMCSSVAFGQDRKSVVIIQSESGCFGTAKLELLELKKIEINGDEKVRLGRGLGLGDAAQVVSKRQYDDEFDREEVRIRDLVKMEYRDGVLVAYPSAQTGIVCLPKKHRVDKNSGKPLSDFFNVSVRGELISGRKQPPIPLSDIDAIFGLDKDVPLDEAGYQYAHGVDSPSVWHWFEKAFTASRHIAEARARRSTATIRCSQAAKQDYLAGKCSRLQDARKLQSAAESIATDQATEQLRMEIDSAEHGVLARVSDIKNLVNAGQFDAAVERGRADDLVTRFSPCYEELSSHHTLALQKSHDQHVASGTRLGSAGQFATAVREFEMALDRRPDSAEARTGWCNAREGAVLGDVESLRRQKAAGSHEKAAGLIEDVMRVDCLARSASLSSTLAAVKEEWAVFLVQEAEVLTTVPGSPPKRGRRERPLTTYREEVDYRSARAKLQKASVLSAQETHEDRLRNLNARLAEFRVKEAAKASAARRVGTAMVHLQQALRYEPSHPPALAKAEEIRAELSERTDFSVGVYFEDLSRQTTHNLAELLAESLRTRMAQQSGYAVVDPSVSRNFYQEYERTGQVPSRFAERPYFFLVGKVFESDVRPTVRQQQLQGLERVGRNAQFDHLDRSYQQWDDEFDRRKRQLGGRHPSTEEAKTQRDYYRRERDRYPEWNDIPYYFVRRDVNVVASSRLFFRLVECVTTRILYADELRENRTWNDYELLNIRPNDVQYQPKSLNLPEPEMSFQALQQDVEEKIAARSKDYLQRLPVEAYYARAAKSAAGGLDANAVEQYILFLNSLRGPAQQEAAHARRYVNEKLSLESEAVLADQNSR